MIEKKNMREELIKRTEVLDTVKKLFLIPQIEMMTGRQVAEYFDVGYEAVKSCYKDHKEEINEDGTYIRTCRDLVKVLGEPLEKTQAKTVYELSENVTVEIPNRGIRCFSKRAVLRIAMLLRKSEVAREVRTQLLNTFETTTAAQRTSKIDEEKELLDEISTAWAKGSVEDFSAATLKYNAFKNRYIAKLETENKQMLEPTAAYNTFINSNGWQKGDAVSRLFNMSRTDFFKALREKDIFTKQSGFNLPYQKYMDKGYFRVCEGSNCGYTFSYTVFSPRGIDFIRTILKKDEAVV